MIKVIETQILKIPATAFEQTHFNVRSLRVQKTRDVASSENHFLGSASSAPNIVAPGTDWEVTSTLVLPRQLQSCVQTTRLPCLEIKHALSVEIQLRRPDYWTVVCHSSILKNEGEY